MSEISKRIDKLRAVNKGLVLVGNNVIKELINNWTSGKGGDTTRFKDLTSDYKARKAAGTVKTSEGNRGGDPIANMTLTGKMQQGLYVKKAGRETVEVTFRTNERPKAEGNQKERKNMMKVSKAFKKEQSKILQSYIAGKAS